MKFAKLFEFEDIGQVLVKLSESQLDESDDSDFDPESERTELRFFFNLPGFGVCEVALGYKDDADWSMASAGLERCDEEIARSVYNSMLMQSRDMLPSLIDASTKP